MNRIVRVINVALVVFAATVAGCDGAEESAAADGSYERIVSLAPSITETLFALGLDDRVVGVTRYCDYPPEALELPRLGGYLDPNYEALVRLRPDLVVTVAEHADAQERLSEFGIAVAKVNHKTVPGIIESMRSLGTLCGVEERGDSLAADIEARIASIQAATEGRDQPTVMMAIGRNMGSATLEDVYIAGDDGFYSELVRMAGGRNISAGGPMRFPVVSAEGILRMNPDIIIDFVADLEQLGLEKDDVRSQWDALPEVAAVRNGRVHVLTGGYVVIPGPRFPLLLEDMARIIHPEIELEPAE